VGVRALLGRLLGREQVRSLARRYFVSNGFDGTLTCIGVIVGSVVGGVPDGATVVAVGLGAAVGLTTSAVWSVWEIERAETQATIRRVERAMLTDLDDTQVQRDQRGARLLHALASGAGPLVGVLVPLSPFVLTLGGGPLTLWQATAAGVALGVGVLGTLGAYMGAVSEQRWYVSAARMGAAGVVVALINLALPG
jgi:predicted membrane protein (TIGR00267 family)